MTCREALKTSFKSYGTTRWKLKDNFLELFTSFQSILHFNANNICLKSYINPFLPNVLVLYPWKKPENQRL